MPLTSASNASLNRPSYASAWASRWCSHSTSGEVTAALEAEEEGPSAGRGLWEELSRLARSRPFLSWLVLAVLVVAAYAPGRIVPGIREALALHSADPRRTA